ncbi:MAG: RNA 2',3'-cyclic phosphodiesterase [Candidatus Methylomirabilales bacterium]
MSDLRLFVAVTLPDAVRARLARAQERLRAVQADVSWVKPENIHLTLKFIGETEVKRLPRIQAALQGVGAEVAAFALMLAGVGTFGGRVPRVVWAGTAEGAEALATLAGRVDDALGRVGIAKERRAFSPHATLGRVRSPRNAEALVAAAAALDETFGRVAVGEFVLMQSRLHPQGSVYTPLDRVALQPAG